jgi:hypothetical protein
MPNVVKALIAMLNVIRAFEYYNAYMIEHVRPYATRHSNDGAKLDCQFDRLCRVDGLVVLALVWKESGFITVEDLEAAGLHRLRDDMKITQHALGTALKASVCRCGSCESDEKYERRAQRIVEAAITFGLIEPQTDRRNLKPLRATQKLHDLMIDVGGAIAVLFGD